MISWNRWMLWVIQFKVHLKSKVYQKHVKGAIAKMLFFQALANIVSDCNLGRLCQFTPQIQIYFWMLDWQTKNIHLKTDNVKKRKVTNLAMHMPGYLLVLQKQQFDWNKGFFFCKILQCFVTLKYFIYYIVGPEFGFCVKAMVCHYLNVCWSFYSLKKKDRLISITFLTATSVSHYLT